MNPEFWSPFLLTGQTFFHQKIEVFQYTILSLKSKLAFVLKYTLNRNYVRGGAEGAVAPPPEFGGSEKRTEGETNNLLLIAPSPHESKS